MNKREKSETKKQEKETDKENSWSKKKEKQTMIERNSLKFRKGESFKKGKEKGTE